MIDYYDKLITHPDFVFPDLKIAIYYGGYGHHSDRDSIAISPQPLDAGIYSGTLRQPTADAFEVS